MASPSFDLPLEEALTGEERAVLAEGAQRIRIEAGARVEAPEGGGALALLSGRLEALRADDGRLIAELLPGAMLAALSALDRQLALRAGEACELVRIAPGGIDRLADLDGSGLASIALRVAESERALQVAIHLSRLFPGLDRRGLEDFGAGVEWLAVRGGEWLFREGEAGDAAYLVISGRLRAVTRDRDGERVLSEVGPGETVGEMSLFTRDQRSAGVHAVRDSQLVRLSRVAFDRLTERHPEALRRITGFVSDRLRRQNAGADSAPRSLAAIAVVGSRPGLPLHELAAGLSSALEAHGSVEIVDRRRVESALGRRDIADAGDHEGAGIRLVRWLNERDGASRYVLYVADPRWSAWTERALRQADHVLVVARSDDGPAPGEIERRLANVWREGCAPQRSLLLLHPSGSQPSGTARWLAARDFDGHFHVRGQDPDDLGRVARLLIGRGVGLVLGGGGARGFAHLGALRALEEAGVTIDYLGGTSIGAVIGGLYALGLSAEQARALCHRSFQQLFDVTLPLVSLLAGRRIGRNLEAAFASREIEDLMVPFFCVATNLSRAEAVVHRRGSLFRAIRASISLPGVLPPVSIDGDLYVDGGLLDNLPIDVMAGLCGGGPVIASDVSPEEDLRVELDRNSALSGWQVLWRRMNPFSPSLEIPSISSVLIRSAVVGSLLRERERKRSGGHSGLHLKLPVEDWGLLEFDKVEPIATRGYDASAEPVRHWWSEQKRALRQR